MKIRAPPSHPGYLPREVEHKKEKEPPPSGHLRVEAVTWAHQPGTHSELQDKNVYSTSRFSFPISREPELFPRVSLFMWVTSRNLRTMLLFLMYLFERQSDTKRWRDRGRKRCAIYWFAPQKTVTNSRSWASLKPGELGMPCMPPMCMART